jgi:serine/threonine protein phosphatase PrpC
VVEQELASGDLLLLTTDGVHGVLDEARLMRLVVSDLPLNAIAEDVIAAALQRGSKDNVTVVVARYE